MPFMNPYLYRILVQNATYQIVCSTQQLFLGLEWMWVEIRWMLHDSLMKP